MKSPNPNSQPSQIDIVVRLFASVREAFGQQQIRLTLPAGSTVNSVVEALCKTQPQMAEMLQATAPAVNRRYADLQQHLSEGDEVAFLPPVGGG